MKREEPDRTGIRKTDGFTLFEVLLTITILLIAIVPLVNAYRPTLFASIGEESHLVFANQARQTLNRVACLDFDTLRRNQGNPIDLNNLFSAADEAFSLHGVTYSPAVSVVDSSGGAGGLLEITVTVGDVTLKALKAAT